MRDTRAKIAAREGLSRARVTQVMNLLEWPEDMQKLVLNPPAPLEVQVFTERSLRVVVSCRDREAQTFRWQGLIRGLGLKFAPK
jgi:hypothetical protein